jgi:hypothetical protein
MTMQQIAESSPYDVYLPHLPEREELDRLEALLSEMLMKAQSELERLSLTPKETCHG